MEKRTIGLMRIKTEASCVTKYIKKKKNFILYLLERISLNTQTTTKQSKLVTSSMAYGYCYIVLEKAISKSILHKY